MLSDGTDILEKLSDNEIYLIIRQLLNELQGRDREFVMLYFGFYDGKIHTQQEIADMFHVSKAYVNRIIMQTVKRLKEKLVTIILITHDADFCNDLIDYNLVLIDTEQHEFHDLRGGSNE